MRRALLALPLVLAACNSDRASLPAACSDKPEDVAAALLRAPGAVTLAGGTTISRCVALADSTAELENVGVTLHTAAQQLRDRAACCEVAQPEGGGFGPDAAVALGYLAGAARKGANDSPGISEEIAVRLERVAGRLMDAEPPLATDVERGVQAGKRLG